MASVKLPKLNFGTADSVSNEFNNFKRQFFNYLDANELNKKTEKVKVAHLKSGLDEEAYSVVEAFDLERETVQSILDELQKYVEPKKSIIAEQFKFFKRQQAEGEPFDKFFIDLKKMAKKCEFGDQEDNLLKVRVVLGVCDSKLQERLLRTPDTTLDKIVDHCRATETALLNQVMMNKDDFKSVDQIKYKDEQMKRSSYAAKNESVKSAYEQQNGPSTSNQSRQQERIKEYDCKKCGYKHGAKQCPAFNKKCLNCGFIGHFKIGCKKGKTDSSNCNKKVDEIFLIDNVSSNNNNVWKKDICINSINISFKLDTGSDINVIPFSYLSMLKINVNNMSSHGIKAQAYGGFWLKVRGKIKLRCIMDGNSVDIEFIIIENDNIRPLLGRDTCKRLGLLVQVVDMVTISEKEKFLQKNKNIFEGLGKLPFKYKITLKKECVPVVRPPRRIPNAIKERLKTTLESLEESGVIQKIDKPTDWVNNLVIAEKKNGNLRICLDPKFLNQAIKRERSYIPTRDDIKNKLVGMKWFTVMDMKEAFYQIELDDESANLCTFITPFGRYRFLRLPFGIITAPEVFQKMAMVAFEGIDEVTVYFDDLIIATKTEQEHREVLNKVVERAIKWGIKFNSDKIQFMKESVKYVGMIFSEKGVLPDSTLTEAISRMREPKNVTEVQQALGLGSYLTEFIPNLAKITSPLRDLMKKTSQWKWEKEEKEAWIKFKETICNPPVLSLFDASKNIVIYCDASKEGLGCCLLQDNKPVAYASRCLSRTEVNYAQIEKEMLAVYFACKKFHQMVYGHKIKIYTDHQPLITIFKKEINEITARLQRFKLGLLKYDIELLFVPGKKNLLADPLSRLYLDDELIGETECSELVHEVVLSPEKVLLVSPEKQKLIKLKTKEDPCLKKILELYYNGWDTTSLDLSNNAELGKLLKEKDFITVSDELIFFNDCIVVPKILRKDVMNKLHSDHMCLAKTVAKAKEVVYWPYMVNDFKNFLSNCMTCNKYKRANIKEPLMVHELALHPFIKIGIDHADIAGKVYLLVIDYYSKWFEAIKVPSKSIMVVIKELEKLFAQFGIPNEIISDNVPFNAHEFKIFCSSNDIIHKRISPKNSQSNGLVEKSVGIFKKMFKKIEYDEKKLWYSILEYRNSPLEGIDLSPAQLMFNRRLKSRIPVCKELLKPEIYNSELIHKMLKCKQEKQKYYYDRTAKERDYESLKNAKELYVLYNGKWIKALNMGEGDTPRSFKVKIANGTIIKRNTKWLKLVQESEYKEMEESENSDMNSIVLEKEGKGEEDKRIRRKPAYLKDYINH